ncbi:MAG: four helix bundle protein [Flavobacteriaceae bacterium]
MALSYKELDIYKISFQLFIETHGFSLKLPKYELYELGSQVRRASDSVNSNIVEGYGRKRYKFDFIKFLTYSHSSNDELINHLKKIQILYPNLEEQATKLILRYDELRTKINKFKQYVEKEWK